jgi:hypothetical protein
MSVDAFRWSRAALGPRCRQVLCLPFFSMRQAKRLPYNFRGTIVDVVDNGIHKTKT